MSRKGGRLYILALVALGIGLAFGVSAISPKKRQNNGINAQFDNENGKNSKSNKSREAGRIICASPAVSEIVCALGLADKICGISDFCDYPAEILQKPRIGGAFNPNHERIVQLAPDLLIGQGRMEAVAKLCNDRGIPCLSVKLDNLADVFVAFREIGEKTGKKREGAQLAANLRSCLDSVREKAAKLPKRKVFLVCGRLPGKLAGFMTVGQGTFLNDVLKVAGGANVFADASGLYPQVSREAVATRRPDVIIELVAFGAGGEKAEKFANARADWHNMAELSGLGGVRVELLGGDIFLKPGPRIAAAAQLLFEKIHQEK